MLPSWWVDLHDIRIAVSLYYFYVLIVVCKLVVCNCCN